MGFCRLQASGHRDGGDSLLGFERLEPRSLMAVAAFTVIAPATVAVGDTFAVEIVAQEFDPRLSGLRRVALDVTWDASVLTCLDADPRTTITSDLPELRTGVAMPGAIRDLGGQAMISRGQGRPIGDNGPERFATLHFQAIAEGDTELTLAQGGSLIVSVPTATFGSRQLRFDSATIQVGASHEASRAPGVEASLAYQPWLDRSGDLCFGLEVGLHRAAKAWHGGSGRGVQVLSQMQLSRVT